MRCKEIKFCIERYIDKSLSVSLHARVEEHLRTCSKCSSAYADFNTVKSSLVGIPIPPAPGNLTEEIMRSVRDSLSSAKNRDEGVLIQWWKEAAVPVRLAFSVVSLIFIAAGVFMGKDLWSAPDSMVNSEYAELDAFSETQKGSLEYGYFQLIHTPGKGDEK